MQSASRTASIGYPACFRLRYRVRLLQAVDVSAEFRSVEKTVPSPGPCGAAEGAPLVRALAEEHRDSRALCLRRAGLDDVLKCSELVERRTNSFVRSAVGVGVVAGVAAERCDEGEEVYDLHSVRQVTVELSPPRAWRIARLPAANEQRLEQRTGSALAPELTKCGMMYMRIGRAGSVGFSATGLYGWPFSE
eukprot:COSAG04_NODE_8562_length_957_cov_3.011655_1_plen_191_part_10